MPIMIPNGLPAAATLAEENIFVMNETRAVTQDICSGARSLANRARSVSNITPA